jgi:hypothetical protein
VPGEGSNVLTFTIPPGVEFNVESVLAEVDTSAAGSTIGELSIADQSGAVIATKRQSTPIPGGSSGSETWALRLDDDTAGSGGSGWQYNIDNTGGWGLLETVGNPTLPTSQPSSFTFGDSPSSYSFAVNSDDGTVFTNNPGTFSHVVTIEAGGNGTLGGTALFIQTDASAGASGTTGILEDINGGSGNTTGVAVAAGSASGTIQGVSSQVDQTSGGATLPAYAVNALATSNGSGDTIGVRCMGHALGGALACALQCVDHTGKPIFEVRDDGSVHILLGTAIIADL